MPSEREAESLWQPQGDPGNQVCGLLGMQRGLWACCCSCCQYRHQQLSYPRRAPRIPSQSPHRREGSHECDDELGRQAFDPRAPASPLPPAAGAAAGGAADGDAGADADAGCNPHLPNRGSPLPP